MKLRQICLENYHGIAQRTCVDIDSFAVFVGRNDVGKSTVFKALDLFLNGITPNPDCRNASTESSIIAIELAFEMPSLAIVIDEAVPTIFADELICDERGLLRIRKEWDVSSPKPTPKISVTRYSFGEEDFLLLSERELIKKCEKYGLPTKKANGEEFNNVEKRNKLREFARLNAFDGAYEWLSLPTSGNSRAKLIFDAIKKVLPIYEYFRADSSLNESDAAIQKYFRNLTVRELSGHGMAEVEGRVRGVLQEVLEGITSKINEVVSDGDRIQPQIDFDWSKAVSTSFRTAGGNVDIPLNQRGDGFRRITMMAYFEHLVERDRSSEQTIIFGFEEPETFLHPSAQEQLFEKLERLCEKGHQVLIASHSPIIVASTKIHSLIHVEKNNGVISYTDNIRDLRAIADDIGIRIENQFISLFDKAKLLLLVEGPDDVLAFNWVANVYKAADLIRQNFEELSVVVLPIGGCGSIQHWVQLDLLRQLSKPYFVLLDSDKESQNEESKNAEKLRELGFVEGRDCAVTKKRCLENYIPAEALNRLVPGAELNYGDFDNVKAICRQHRLAGQLGGAGVAARYFERLTLNDLRASFCPDGNEDEFLSIYGRLQNILAENQGRQAAA